MGYSTVFLYVIGFFRLSEIIFLAEVVHVNSWEYTYAYDTVQYDFLFLKSLTHPQLKSHMVHLLTIKFFTSLDL